MAQNSAILPPEKPEDTQNDILGSFQPNLMTKFKVIDKKP